MPMTMSKEPRPRDSTESTTSSQPLNPTMVYAPPRSPASPSSRGHDDDDDRPKRPLCAIACRTTVRLLALILAFADIVAQLAGRPRAGLLVFLVMWTALIFVWNLILSIPSKGWRACFGPRKPDESDVPEVSCIIGKWKLNFLGGHDDQDDDRTTMSVGWVVDLVFGGVLVLCTGLASTLPHNVMSPRANMTANTVMGYMLGAFELVIALLQLIPCCTPVHFTINRDSHEYQYRRIQLSEDVDAPATSMRPVSISA
ncbi:hypothetical protein F4779DRAFT_384336 [Xylariaceae sp. FL0662B]|nr:hypothetical protein F4779DRAFT_384336 [Xylariaceae sp. FL0662B]